MDRELGMGRGMSFLVMQCRAASSCSAAVPASSAVHVLQGAWFGIGPLAYMVVLGGFAIFMGIVVTRLGVVIDKKNGLLTFKLATFESNDEALLTK